MPNASPTPLLSRRAAARALPLLAAATPVAAAQGWPTVRHQDVGGTPFAYRSLGEGEPAILLLNRFRGTVDDWDPAFVAALARGRRVIALDNRGVGGSGGEVPVTIAAMAEDVARFARAMGIVRVDLVGWSMGGPVATVAAIDHPGLVRRFAVIGSTPPGRPVAEVAPTTEEFRRRAGKPEWDFEDFVFLFFRDTPGSRRAARASFDRLAAARGQGDGVPSVPRAAFARQSEAIRAYDADAGGHLARFAGIRQPAMVLTGDHDAAFPVSVAVEYHRRIGRSRLAVLPDAGHAPHGQYPGVVAGLLDAFLAGESEPA